jgi:hypothetical protein
MNPNDLMAQQQAYLNQMLHTTQQWQLAYVAIALAAFIIHCWVVYMFYARLSDIADELRRLRIAFEFAEDRKARDHRMLSARIHSRPMIATNRARRIVRRHPNATAELSKRHKSTSVPR